MTDPTRAESAGATAAHGASGRSRGQANLVALVGALFALTVAMVVGLAVADSALVDEVGDPGERHAARAVAGQFVTAESPLTNRSNVLAGPAVDALTASRLRSRYPVLDGRSFRVSLDGEVLASAGTPDGGATVRRIVLVERTGEVTIRPAFSSGNLATLPRRTDTVEMTIDPPENVTVDTVRADRRTVLYDPNDGLAGTHTVALDRRETVDLAFLANGSLSRGNVTLTLTPRNTTKATLAVTVDD